MTENDPLWQHFAPLWRDLREIGAPSLSLAGGYGLFLKQRMLVRSSKENQPIAVAVPLERWLNATPRVTKDVDVVVPVEIIANAEALREISRLLDKHGFEERKGRERWQFEKKISANAKTILDLHSPSPEMPIGSVDADRFRVKHKPSLGKDGVHGRTNPEAAGCEHCQFVFEWDGVSIRLPNSVTWSVMKLVAARDRWKTAESPEEDDSDRSFARDHALKHAQDVFRIVAMTTRDENDDLHRVVATLRSTPFFVVASNAATELFDDDRHALRRSLNSFWSEEDIATMRTILRSWFTEPPATRP